MMKPNIIRLRQCKFFPNKKFYSDETIKKYFINQTIIITEKYDGSPFFNKDIGFFYEILNNKGVIKYQITKTTRMAVARKYNTMKTFEIMPREYMWRPKYLFENKINNLKDLLSLVDILKKMDSALKNNRDNKMEGVVIYSVKSKKWAKSHNDWFLEILQNAPSKNSKVGFDD